MTVIDIETIGVVVTPMRVPASGIDETDHVVTIAVQGASTATICTGATITGDKRTGTYRHTAERNNTTGPTLQTPY